MRIFAISAILISALLAANPCGAEESKPKCLEGIEFLTGFSWGKLKDKPDYHLNPFMLDLDFNLKPLLKKINLEPQPLLQFQIEPFLSLVTKPDPNIESGTAFLLKAGLLPQSVKFQPFILAGAGMLYMSQHTREQKTQFNFIEYGGAGIHYFFRKNTALTFEYRFRHLSNASIDYPNRGINTHSTIIGLSYQF